MALANGDIVSISVSASIGVSGLAGPLVQQQPPEVGVVADSASVKVLWQNGTFSTGVAALAFDRIGAPNAGVVTSLQGRFVMIAGESPEYQGIVVALYTRDPAGGGSPTATLALVHTNVGTYREVLASALTVVETR